MTRISRDASLRTRLARAAVALVVAAVLPWAVLWVLLCLLLMAASLPLLLVLLWIAAVSTPGTVRMPVSSRRPATRAARGQPAVSASDWERAVREHAAWVDSLEIEETAGRRAVFDQRDLRGRHAHQVNLSGATFVEADLTDAAFKRCRLRGADFDQATLVGAHFDECRLDEATFDQATLVGAHFDECRLDNATFYQADLRRADLRCAQGLSWQQLGGTDLEGTLLPDSVAEFPTLDAVGQSSAAARSAFLLLLVASIYVWLTTASTTDVALIKDTDSLALPIIATQVSIEHFYVVAPALLLGVSLYFHLYLVRLCQLMTSVPAVFPDGRTLEQRAHPWLFNGLMSTRLRRLRERVTRLQALLFVASVPVIWGLVPLTLGYLWLRYLARHQPLISGLHLVLVLLATMVAVASLFSVLRILHGRRASLSAGRVLGGALVRSLLVAAVLAPLGLMITRGGVDFGAAGGVSWDQPERDAERRRPENTHPRYTSFGATDPATWGPALLACLKLKPVIDVSRTDVSTKPPGWKGERPEDWNLVAGARLKDIDLNYALAERAFLLGADLRGARMVGADLRDADLRRADLSDAKLPHAQLAFADLRQAVLSQAILFHARIPDSRMDDCLLHFARLEHAQLQRAHLERAEMNGANLQCAQLEGARLNEVKASGARFAGAGLADADLRGAILQGASLVGADLTKADLRCAVLVGADLRGATVTGVRLENAVLDNVILDEATRDALLSEGATLDFIQLVPYDPEKDAPECCRGESAETDARAAANRPPWTRLSRSR